MSRDLLFGLLDRFSSITIYRDRLDVKGGSLLSRRGRDEDPGPGPGRSTILRSGFAVLFVGHRVVAPQLHEALVEGVGQDIVVVGARGEGPIGNASIWNAVLMPPSSKYRSHSSPRVSPASLRKRSNASGCRRQPRRSWSSGGPGPAQVLPGRCGDLLSPGPEG